MAASNDNHAIINHILHVLQTLTHSKQLLFKWREITSNVSINGIKPANKTHTVCFKKYCKYFCYLHFYRVPMFFRFLLIHAFKCKNHCYKLVCSMLPTDLLTVRVCVRACARTCVHASVHTCMCACVYKYRQISDMLRTFGLIERLEAKLE